MTTKQQEQLTHKLITGIECSVYNMIEDRLFGREKFAAEIMDNESDLESLLRSAESAAALAVESVLDHAIEFGVS